jgi:hypothetical protein
LRTTLAPAAAHQPLRRTHSRIGLEEVGDGVWNLVYYRSLLGKIDERTGQITGI